jgi:hypothetical protein
MNNKKMFKSFIKACESQWREGGKRYAYSEEKESTDLITEIAGNQWIGGNIAKYVFEIWNAKRNMEKLPEVDFFKVAVYSFIWWIKELKQKYTTVKLKEKYWPEFIRETEHLSLGLEKIIINKDMFFSSVRYLIEEDSKNEWCYFQLAADAFNWWLQEQDNLTDRDKGEEFEK